MKIKTIISTTMLLLSLVIVAEAQTNLRSRTYVSSSGSDANTCAFSSQCRTFGGALAKTMDGGEITALDSAFFGDQISITKSVTIQAAPGVHAILGELLATTVVEINTTSGSSLVILRNLYISRGRRATGASTTGISINSYGHVRIENCTITGFTMAGISASHPPPSNEFPLFITDSTLSNNQYGVSLINYAASIHRTKIESNSTGILLANNGVNTGTTLSDCLITGNAYAGIWLQGGRLDVENCVIIANLRGIYSTPAVLEDAINVSNTRISGNVTGLDRFATAIIRSFGNNRLYGNQTDGTFTSTIAQQ